ncbi:hypothetical protein NQZ68_005666 [Dissostichus eleginoides]|nr:hypothetical protein NQZ68_005666 [Dissostichus eleginoides]
MWSGDLQEPDRTPNSIRGLEGKRAGAEVHLCTCLDLTNHQNSVSGGAVQSTLVVRQWRIGRASLTTICPTRQLCRGKETQFILNREGKVSTKSSKAPRRRHQARSGAPQQSAFDEERGEGTGNRSVCPSSSQHFWVWNLSGAGGPRTAGWVT